MSLFSKTISKVSFFITALYISFKKGECFDFNHGLENLPYFIHQNYTFRSSLAIQLHDLFYPYSFADVIAFTFIVKHHLKENFIWRNGIISKVGNPNYLKTTIKVCSVEN